MNFFPKRIFEQYFLDAFDNGYEFSKDELMEIYKEIPYSDDEVGNAILKGFYVFKVNERIFKMKSDFSSIEEIDLNEFRKTIEIQSKELELKNKILKEHNQKADEILSTTVKELQDLFTTTRDKLGVDVPRGFSKDGFNNYIENHFKLRLHNFVNSLNETLKD